MDALVLGSGVIGLTTALRLQEAGWRVTIRTARPWEETVSNTAAAIWYPFHAFPLERVDAWSARALEVFADEARVPESGVRIVAGRLLWRDPAHAPALVELPEPPEPIPPGELPEGVRFGVTARLPCIDMPVYLPWLERRFRQAGGALERRSVASLDGAVRDATLVVNCTGLGARELVPDDAVLPIRGQVVVVEHPGIDRFTLDVDDEGEQVTYVIPRSRSLVLGGTAEPGRWEMEPDPAVAAGVLARCTALEPGLGEARVLGHAVGLRPGRPAVRVEAEPRGGGTVIHNYGHGGAGVTISWGCAEEVVGLARDLR